ncbi:hypothetical protein Tco_0939917 [Tanacetum coccineum]|uniref:Uncharacterized protein n=1 Tax=Tanacetum coccineum TaxID=301880 RepID=A0ABQ5DNU0_9ASTR
MDFSEFYKELIAEFFLKDLDIFSHVLKLDDLIELSRWKQIKPQTTNKNSIRSILKKEKLYGSNLLDWYRNLRIVLRNEQKLHHLEEALPEAPPTTATTTVRNATLIGLLNNKK